ncbi:uncharacterized protein LOC129609319 [Condylostylus longicornis]|uniref:uncharacterized protein LOC129609319 n=1 Tax=Condylostylus longicornis TaxID=2530218 RepID=UPI00244DAE34|nr:uncharacterized protein LOC129609319 [Condylostylus longicornis]
MFSEKNSEKLLNKSTFYIEKYCNKFFRNLPPKKYYKSEINSTIEIKQNIQNLYKEQNNIRNIKNSKKNKNNNSIKKFLKNLFKSANNLNLKDKIKKLIDKTKFNKKNDVKNRRCYIASAVAAAVFFYTAIIFLLQIIINKFLIKSIIINSTTTTTAQTVIPTATASLISTTKISTIISTILLFIIELFTIILIIIFIIIGKLLLDNYIKRIQKRKEIFNTLSTIDFLIKLNFHKISYQIYNAIIMKVNKLKILPTVIGWRVGISMVKPDPGD